MTMQEQRPALGTRAVERPAVPGQQHECADCGTKIKFQARVRNKIVYANVYEGETWDRLECFHTPCYLGAGSPHGPLDRSRSNELPSRKKP